MFYLLHSLTMRSSPVMPNNGGCTWRHQAIKRLPIQRLLLYELFALGKIIFRDSVSSFKELNRMIWVGMEG